MIFNLIKATLNDGNFPQIKQMKRKPSVLLFVVTLWVAPLQARDGREDELKKRIQCNMAELDVPGFTYDVHVLNLSLPTEEPWANLS